MKDLKKQIRYFMKFLFARSFYEINCNKLIVFSSIIFFIIFSTSCVDTQKLKYFSNLSDSQIVHLPNVQRSQAIIMPDDILDVKIAGANEGTAALFNTYSANPSTNAASSNTTNLSGYLVDINGEIEFPVIGKIKAAGLTKDQFKEKLKAAVSTYLKEPLISVRFANFRFTVLGEVKVPGSFVVNNERVTILEALGLAGDMTSYSKRTGVRIIRDSSGVREIGIVDFADKSIFNSKYYYLQRNDVIYIEPEKYKTRFEDISRISSITATIVSLIAISITVIRR